MTEIVVHAVNQEHRHVARRLARPIQRTLHRERVELHVAGARLSGRSGDAASEQQHAGRQQPDGAGHGQGLYFTVAGSRACRAVLSAVARSASKHRRTLARRRVAGLDGFDRIEKHRPRHDARVGTERGCDEDHPGGAPSPLGAGRALTVPGAVSARGADAARHRRARSRARQRLPARRAGAHRRGDRRRLRRRCRAAREVRRAVQAAEVRAVRRSRGHARSHETGSRRLVHQYPGSSTGRRSRRAAARPRDDGEAAGREHCGGATHPPRRRERKDPGLRQLRDDLVSEPRRDVEADEGTEGWRRDPEDGGHGRPQRPESDQRAARIPGLAVGPRPERRRRAVRLRLLRRQPDDVDDGQPAAACRYRGHAALSARRLPAGRRRGDDPRRVSDRPGHHPGVMELAVQPQGFRGLWRSRAGHCHRRQRPARRAAEGTGTRSDARTARRRRARFDLAPESRRPRQPPAERAVVAREQPDRDRDPRSRA